MLSIEEELKSRLSSRVLACPVGGRNTTIQLVDEMLSGEPYTGLAYTAIDCEGLKYPGYLDGHGIGTVSNHFAAPIAVLFDQIYEGNGARHLPTIAHARDRQRLQDRRYAEDMTASRGRIF